MSKYHTTPPIKTEIITHSIAGEVLTNDPNTNMYVYGDIVYTQSENIEWVGHLHLLSSFRRRTCHVPLINLRTKPVIICPISYHHRYDSIHIVD